MCHFSLQGLVTVFGLAASIAPVDHTIPVFIHVIRHRPHAAAEAPNVLWPGDRAHVEVWAHPPAGAYAFASAEFDVNTEPGLPGWTLYLDQNSSGSPLENIVVSQPHNPARGIFADPSNPIGVWTGVYSPECLDPRLLKVETMPSAFSYYPSRSTSAEVEMEAAGGHDWLLINPLAIGEALVAPGAGTTLEREISDDVVFGGLGSDGQTVRFGWLAQDDQKVRVEPDTSPTGSTYEVGFAASDAPVADPYKNFKFLVKFPPAPQDSTYDLQANWPPADEYEYRVSLGAFAGQTVRIRIEAADASTASLQLERLPDAYSSRVRLDERADETRAISRLEYDEPVRVIAPDGRVLTADTIEVHAIEHGLRPMELGVQVFELEGVGGVNASFGDGSVRFVSSGVGAGTW